MPLRASVLSSKATQHKHVYDLPLNDDTAPVSMAMSPRRCLHGARLHGDVVASRHLTPPRRSATWKRLLSPPRPLRGSPRELFEFKMSNFKVSNRVVFRRHRGADASTAREREMSGGREGFALMRFKRGYCRFTNCSFLVSL